MDGPGSMRGWAGAPGRRSAQWRTGPSRGSEASGKTPDGSDSGHVSLASRRPYTARSGRLMFSARHTRSHSPRALSRTLNRRKPGTSSIQPLGAATCVARTAPLVSPASRPSGVSPGACARRGALSFPPPAPAPHTRRYPALRAPTSPAHSRQHRLGLRGLLHLIEQPRHLALVARVRCQLRRDNQPMLAIDGHLRVAALPEPLGAGLHDGAVRVGEVALVFGFPASAWLPTPALPRRPRASSASRCAASNRAFAATIAANRSARRRNSSGNSSPRSDPPKRASSSASVSRACSASIASTPLLRAHPTVAHRLALARVRPNPVSFTKLESPVSRARRTTSTNNPSNSSRCRRRNSHSVRWSSPPPETPRPPPASSPSPATPPSHTRRAAP